MVRSRMELKGDRELVRQLRTAMTNVEKEGKTAVREWAKDTRKTAREKAPVETGVLRKALSYRTKKGLVAEVGFWGKKLKEAFYVWWVHDGTQRIKAQPFLNEAFLENRDMTPYLRRLLERLMP